MSFLKHIEEIRQRARQTMEDGAVTHDYRLDPVQAVRVLNEALATAIPAGCTSPTKSQGTRMPAKRSIRKRHAVPGQEGFSSEIRSRELEGEDLCYEV
jgi:hypothetical protein